MSIHCPNCDNEEKESALFCSVCGTKLVDEEGERTMPIFDPQVGGLPTNRLSNDTGSLEPALDDARVTLQIIRGGQIVPLTGEGEFILGRVSEGQSILPDIDLEKFEAYEAGVSRLHALINIDEKGISITDLGSSNGTMLNKQALAPHKEQSLKHRDIIRLGRLNIQALVRDK